VCAYYCGVLEGSFLGQGPQAMVTPFETLQRLMQPQPPGCVGRL
jgi:hypothetical protein